MLTFGKFVILCALVTLSYVDAKCSCYENNYTGRSAPISTAYDHDNFSPCAMNCSFIADTGDDNYIWSRLTMRWGSTSNVNGKITIYDGVTEDAPKLVEILEDENVLAGTGKSTIKSTSSKILIKYEQQGEGLNVYYGLIKGFVRNQI